MQVRNLFAGLDDAVHQAVVLGFLRRHVVVAVAVRLNLSRALPGMKGKDFVRSFVHPNQILDLDFDIARLPSAAALRLMNHDAGVGQGKAFALSARAQQHSARAQRLTDAVSVHVAGQKLHRVVNRQAGGNVASRRIDIQVNVLFLIRHLQKKQLGNDYISHGIIYRRAQKNDPILEQTRINIVHSLPPAGFFNHHRNEITVCRFHRHWPKQLNENPPERQEKFPLAPQFPPQLKNTK